MYTIIIEGPVRTWVHDYRPLTFREACGVARELSRDFRGWIATVHFDKPMTPRRFMNGEPVTQ